MDFGYDAGGRVNGVTIPGGALTYAYQATTGNLSSIGGPYGGSLAMTYDGALLTSMTWAGAVSGSVGATYDNDFRVTQLRVNSANSVAFTYDSDGLLTAAGALTVARDAASGRVTGTTLSSVTTSQTYTSFGELASLGASFSGSGLYSSTYTRDAIGRTASKVEVIGPDTVTFAYTYDTAGRLQEVKRNGTTVEAYEYDANGNRTLSTNAGGTAVGVYDAQDRLVSYGSQTFTYTQNGELTARIQGADTTSYVYDVLGNLLSVRLQNGTLIEYVVDGVGRRIGRKVNGTLQQGWLYQDGLNPIAELDGTGAVVSRFVYGTRANVPEHVVKGGVTYRIVADELGSVRLVVDVGTGAVAQRIDYDAWGRVLVNTSPGFQPFGFAGGIYDSTTGLVRFGARDYDAGVGRWTSKDPVGFRGSTRNLYEYTQNDPVNFIDPTGLVGECQAFLDRIWENIALTNSLWPFIGGIPAASLTTAPWFARITGQQNAVGFLVDLFKGVRFWPAANGYALGAFEVGLGTVSAAVVNAVLANAIAIGGFEIGVAWQSFVQALVAELMEDPRCKNCPGK